MKMILMVVDKKTVLIFEIIALPSAGHKRLDIVKVIGLKSLGWDGFRQ